jgi:hypothetical protein
LDVEVGLGAHLVFGGTVLFGGIGVDIVGRTTMTTGDDDPFASLFLDVVEEIDKDRIDVFLPVDDGEAMTGAPITVNEGDGSGGIRHVELGWVEGGPFAAEELLSDPGQVGLRFPRIRGASEMRRRLDGIEQVILRTVNRLRLAVEFPNLLPFRVLHTRTADKKEGQ